jgi:hypothetical protein
MIVQVDSKVKFFGSVRAFCEEEVKDETMLFNCGLNESHAMGDNITKDFIEALPDDWFDGPVIVDSRTHMLMPGWHTCIPGWHHDDVPRTRSDGQPNYEEGQIRSEHVMLLVGSDVCLTEFAIGELSYAIPLAG